MCGICGMLGVSDKSVLERMMNVIVHRGPDDSGMYIDDHCAIGNRRLSIIDLGGGHQPMHNEDETIFVVFNGEIYNFIKLREELEKKGHRFHTNCDTEILVHLYEDYGTEMLSKLDGMFGFCIWDSKNKIAFLARDPIGIKPLHYAKIDDGLIFGSEVKSLLEFKGFEKKLNKEGVWAFLNQGYIPSDQTMLEGIFRLRAGHYLLWNGNSGAFTVKRFWDIRLGNEEGSVDFHTKTVRALLEKAVGKRLHADVPMGFFFSGGSDSLSIVALARKLRPHDKFETFTLFDEKSPASLSEARTAKEMAAKYEMDHHEYPLDYNDVSLYDKAIWHNDEPRSNMLYNYLLSLKANKYVKVILTGVGGDELFAGYNRNRLVWKLRFVPLVVPRWTGRLIPTQGDLKRRVTQLASTSKDRKQFYINFMPTGPLRDSEVDMWSAGGDLNPHIYNEFIGEEGSISEAYLKTQLLTYLPQCLLHVLDRETMACSMEGRVPLCDVNLTEHAFRVPYRLKVKSFKHIFNQAVKDIVPAEIFKRKKGAFGGEPGRWIAGGIGDILKQRLEKVQAPFVSQDFVNKLVAKPEKTQREYDHLWNLLAYESWFRIYMLGDKIGV